MALVAGFLMVIAASAQAQASECAGYSGSTGRVRTAAVDGTRGFHPVAGLLISGGNPLLGTAGTQETTTDFEDFDPDKGKVFAGLGLRLGI